MNLDSMELGIPIEPLDLYRSDRNPSDLGKVAKLKVNPLASCRHQIHHATTYQFIVSAALRRLKVNPIMQGNWI
jgi:hypothetical protein